MFPCTGIRDFKIHVFITHIVNDHLEWVSKWGKKMNKFLFFSVRVYGLLSFILFFSPSDFLFYKSHDIAEQMTLLDAELFQKIEVKLNK